MVFDSNNQRLNTSSLTKDDLVATTDFIPKFLWSDRFMVEQGYVLEIKLFQESRDTMIRETKGRLFLGKCSRTINICYFAIKDSVEKGEVKILN